MDKFGISTEELQAQIFRLDEDRSGAVVGACSALAAVSTVAVVLRLSSRRIMRAALGIDDYMLIISLVGLVMNRYCLHCSHLIALGLRAIGSYIYRLVGVEISYETHH